MKLVALRRSRTLAALLLALSPAGLGTVLPVIHPCPVDAPWLDQGDRPAPASHHGSHDSTDPSSGTHDCVCIGACVGTAVPGAAPADPVARMLFAGALPWVSRDASLRLAPLAALLPPSTAPPVS